MSSPIDEAIAEAVRRQLEATLPEALEKALAEHAPAAPALLDGEGLAKELKISRKTLRRLELQGLPHVKLVEARRYELDRVLEWLRARSETPGLRLVGGGK